MTGEEVRESAQPGQDAVRVWYDARYASAGLAAMRPPAAYVAYLDFLGVQPGRRLLDVSCGAGHLLRAGAERGLQTCGIDLSFQAVRLAQEVSPASTIVVGVADALAFASETFDYVTCIGSLEHYPKPERALAEMQRVAKAEAGFCIVVPNADFLAWKWARFGTEQRDVIERLRSLDEWRQLFVASGFRTIAVTRDPWYLKRPRLRHPLLRVFERAIYRLAWLLLPLRATYQFQFRLVPRAPG